MGDSRGSLLQVGDSEMRKISMVLFMILVLSCSVISNGAFAAELPEGVTEVKDPKTGEMRYRLRGEQDSDPRTYTYEQMMQEEEGYEPEGSESYDEDDDYHDVVSVSNIDLLATYYDDGYDVANLKVYLANYLYYFTGDDESSYEAELIESSFRNSSKYGGIICFALTVDAFPGKIIECEYHKKFRLFGFKSGIGDMSLYAQFYISDSGYNITAGTLKEYAAGTLVRLTPRSGSSKRNPKERAYISSVTWNGETITAERFFYIDEEAERTLLGNEDYTESSMDRMLLTFRKKSKGGVRFTDCLPELWDFYMETGVDIAGVLAIAATEGALEDSKNTEHWNFFNTPTPKGGTSIADTDLWDAKADCRTMGEAMVSEFRWMYKNYLLKGQDTFYKMSFDGYGKPESKEDADKAAVNHSYRPWFTDRSYILSGFDDYYAWCNKCARYRKEFINAAD